MAQAFAVQSGDHILAEHNLKVVTCWCGIVFAIPSNREQWMRKSDDNNCHCPEGHTFIFTDNRDEKRRRELQAAKDKAARIAAERDQAEASLRAQKAATTRAKKRSAFAVCPCCHRSFKQLRRHMASQHPDFNPEEDSTT